MSFCAKESSFPSMPNIAAPVAPHGEIDRDAEHQQREELEKKDVGQVSTPFFQTDSSSASRKPLP